MMRIAVISITIAFCLYVGLAGAQNVSDEAMRHFDRGQAAVEMAKTPADYEDAVREFEKAARLAPDWPDVYYNLGLIQEKVGRYDNAIRDLSKYLELSPNASDVREVKRFIAKIEYIIEKVKADHDKIKDFLGTWDHGVHSFVFTAKNGLLVCQPSSTEVPGTVVSTQVDERKIKIERYVVDSWALREEFEYHLELISKTLMKGTLFSKVISARDRENADMIGKTDRTYVTLKKR